MPFQPGPARRHDGLVGGRASWLAASKPRSKPCGSVTLYVRQSHAAPLSSLPLPVWINPCSHLANFGLHVAPKSAQNELYLVPVGCRFVTFISLHLAPIWHCAAQFAPFSSCSMLALIRRWLAVSRSYHYAFSSQSAPVWLLYYLIIRCDECFLREREREST